MMLRVGVVLGAGLLSPWLVACGGGGVASPSPPTTVPAPAPVVRSGATDAVVAAEVQPPGPPLGASIVVRAAGFLVREQVFAGEPIRLWPDLGSDFIRALSYGVAFVPGVPSDRLLKWTGGFNVTASPELLADPGVSEGLGAALALAGQASGLAVGLAGAGPVVVKLDPADPLFAAQPGLGAFTVVVARGDGGIESASVVLRDLRQGRRVELLAHEMGHVLGLSHVNDPGALMFGGVLNRDRFDERELQCLRMMYAYRSPGNRFPDRDPGFSASGAVRQVAWYTDCERGSLR